MRFVLDENHPQLLASILRPLLSDESHRIVHVSDLGLHGASDVDILEGLRTATGRQVLITGDKRMRQKPHERAAIVATGTIVIIGAKGWNHASLIDRARVMVWCWPRIVAAALAARPGTCWELPWKPGQASPLKPWR